MRRSNKDRLLILIFTINLALFLSCSSDSPTSSDAAPEIPPPGTMTIDLSLFTSNTPKTDINHLTKINFFTAVTVVTVVNAFVLVGLAVPVAATTAALSVEPELEADGKFHWRFSHDALTLHLTGEVKPQVVEWQMFVTRQLPTPLDNFLWYEGESGINNDAGFWQFYDETQPGSHVATIRIDYDYSSETNKTLSFLNNKEGSAGFGDTIAYEVDNDIVTMTLLEASTGDAVEISWSRTSGEGYIIAPDFNNGNKACWDETQEDIVCSN